MSKPVKNLIVSSYARRFEGVDGGVLIDIRGIASNDNNSLRNSLADKQIRVTVVKNSLAKRAWDDTPLAGMTNLLEGSCAVAYGGESVVHIARELIDQAKTYDLEFKGALMEGQVFQADQVDALSKYPTRDEAQGQVIAVLLAPAAQVIGAAVAAGNQIASILKTIQEKLEGGEEIKKAG